MARDFPHLTDVLGSFPMIRRYSLISLFFPLPGDTADVQDEVVAHLQQALASLASDVPWLAGRVVFEGLDAGHSGIRHIVSHEGSTIPLLVKRLPCRPAGGEFPSSFAQLQDAGFPMSALDPDVLVPPIAVSWDSTDPDTVAPVLVLQANFLDGGLILTVCSNHTTMDMTGLGMVIGYLAKVCRGERLTAEEVEQANQDRRGAVPLLGDDYEPGPELDDSLVKPVGKAQRGVSTTTTTTANEPAAARWAYFRLDGAALAELKREAGRQDAVPYITTDDAVTARGARRGRRPAAPFQRVRHHDRPPGRQERRDQRRPPRPARRPRRFVVHKPALVRGVVRSTSRHPRRGQAAQDGAISEPAVPDAQGRRGRHCCCRMPGRRRYHVFETGRGDGQVCGLYWLAVLCLRRWSDTRANYPKSSD